MNLGFEYIKYQWKAKRRHGVHSPFVYDLTDKCFRIPVSNNLKEVLKKLDYKLRNDTRSIEISDFGAGSKKLSNNRKIRSIYNTSSSRGRYGKLLFQLVNHFKPKTVLEFGTSMGIGSICLASGNDQTKVITVEGCPNTFAVARENISETSLSNIEIHNSTFDAYLDTLKDELFDLVFIDGHHDGPALKHYLERLHPHSHGNTIFILDDIRWSDSMFNAWSEIQADIQNHVTIDLFRMAIVVARPEQEKEHFVIR
jgi:predicted O-methyltransferase YrrM